MQRRTFEISIPKIDWRALFSLPVILALVAGAGCAYWWKAVRPFYRTQSAVLQVPALQIYAAGAGRLESYFFEEGGRFLQGQSLLRLRNEGLSVQAEEIDRELAACERRMGEERARVDLLMERYIQAQDEGEIHSILTQVQEAQGNGAELDRELELLRNQRGSLEKKIEPLTFLAPFEGVVLRHLKQTGEWIDSGEAVLSICNAKERWIETFVPEVLLGSLRVGAEAWIEFPSFAGKKWKGSVSWISPLVEEGKIRVKLAAPDLPLHPGLSAKTQIKVH